MDCVREDEGENQRSKTIGYGRCWVLGPGEELGGERINSVGWGPRKRGRESASRIETQTDTFFGSMRERKSVCATRPNLASLNSEISTFQETKFQKREEFVTYVEHYTSALVPLAAEVLGVYVRATECYGQVSVTNLPSMIIDKDIITLDTPMHGYKSMVIHIQAI
ncbi:hypothetical protein VNO77_26819 [Canavalia gladiata]|uniref:Uncharacterized protein n=1 Tax=Canavalia gladiata TaxID=3824 RepID=A0AAN9KXQ9_CANGL